MRSATLLLITLVTAAAVGGITSATLTFEGTARAAEYRPLLQELAAKEAIREQIARYTILHDGDGATRDGRLWADSLWTRDATFQVIYPDGTRKLGNGEIGLQGREAIYRAFATGRPAPPGLALRHVLVDTTFDSVRDRTARTRTVEFVIFGKLPVGAPAHAGGAQMTIPAYVTHDTWRKGDDGQWRKSRSVVYCTVSCPDLLPPGKMSR